MSVCTKCRKVMSDCDYAAEGMCHECYYDDILDKEAKLKEEGIPDEEDLSAELEPYIDEIMRVLYSEGSDDKF